MIKRYLNRDEKNQTLTLAAFIGFMSERAEESAKLGRSKDLVKFLRTSKTYADKALALIMLPLDNDEKFKLLSEIPKMSVVTKYKRGAVRGFEEAKKIDSVTPVNTDDFIDIVEHAIVGACQKCTLTGEDADNCRLKKHFINYDIEPYDLKTPAGKCPYQY